MMDAMLCEMMLSNFQGLSENIRVILFALLEYTWVGAQNLKKALKYLCHIDFQV